MILRQKPGKQILNKLMEKENFSHCLTKHKEGTKLLSRSFLTSPLDISLTLRPHDHWKSNLIFIVCVANRATNVKYINI
jgi:hypothetical protein